MKTRNEKKAQFIISLLLLFVMLLPAIHSLAQEKQALVSAEKVSIKSTVLNEDRVISIFLPDNYEATSQKYPVLYLLDGRTHFQHAIAASTFLSNGGIIPQMIVVSIHNVDRNRDFSPVHTERIPTSGGAVKFLNFLSDELTPYILEKYNASSFSILLGHSFGGTFAAYSLLTNPELFDGYIAISPFLQYANNYMVNESNKLLIPKSNHPMYFYMTVGNEPDYFQPLEEFSATIQEKSKEAIEFEYVKMKSENHASIPYITLFKGLRFIFSEWQLPQEKYAEGLDAIDTHYENISSRFGFEIKTPENVINLLGYRYLQNNNNEKAIETFKENVKRYPESANVYDSLGEAYETNEQLDLAKKNYQKAAELGVKNNDPNIAIYQKNLERVQ
jgi:predicted alpha/beta superfamily hydrolase